MSTEGWRERRLAALGAGGCTTSAEWAEKCPGLHCWFVFDLGQDGGSCVLCGLMRMHEGKNKPCKGITRIALRGTEP